MQTDNKIQAPKLTRPTSFSKPVQLPNSEEVHTVIAAAKVTRTSNAGLAYQPSGGGRKSRKEKFTCYIDADLIGAIKFLADLDVRSESYVAGQQMAPLIKAARDLGYKPPEL